MFWNYNDSNFICEFLFLFFDSFVYKVTHPLLIAIGMKNNIVNTYLIDEVEEQKAVNFQSFIRDKWDLWTGRCY